MACGSYNVLERGNDTHYSHHVLAVDAKDKGSYIIDLSGAQVGLNVLVMPLAAYMERFGATIRSVHDHEYTFACLKDNIISEDRGRRIGATQWKMYEAMSDAMMWFEVDHLNSRNLDAMLEKPEDVYQDFKSWLTKRLQKAYRDAFDKRAASNHSRTKAKALGIKLSEEEIACLRDGECTSPDQAAQSGIRWRWSQELAERKASYAGIASEGSESPVWDEKLPVR